MKRLLLAVAAMLAIAGCNVDDAKVASGDLSKALTQQPSQ